MTSEFDFIRSILTLSAPHKDLIVGNGDDAAVIRIGLGLLAISVDTVIENTHFSLSYSTPQQVGIKAVESSLSDIVAVGGTLEFIVVAITIPKGADHTVASSIYEGIASACSRTGVVVIGGDTTVGGDSWTLSVTSFGRLASEEQIVRRNGARPGDLIFVTGPLGGSAAGLHALQNKIAGFDSLTKRHLAPCCRDDLAGRLGGIASSAIDISDGLSSELTHICQASSVGCLVREDSVPVDPETVRLASLLGLDPYQWAWHGGEDYELLVTCSPKIKNEAPGICIGEITSNSELLVESKGQTKRITRGGFDHFKQVTG